MAMIHALITGRITPPGSDVVPGRLRVTAAPETEDSALTFPGERATWGPTPPVITDESGNLGAGLKIPLNSATPGVLWKLIVEPIDRNPSLPSKWVVGPFAITEDKRFDQLVTVATTAVTPEVIESVSEYAAQAESAAAAAVAVGTTNDTIIAGRIKTPGSATKAALDESYVASGGTSGVHVDLARPVNAAQRMKQDLINVTLTGDVIATLGAPPIAGQVAVWVKTGSAAAARLLPGDYAVAGSTVTITAVTAGSKVLIEYMYDSDTVASPASASSNQYALFDDFNRTTTPGAQAAVATAIGAAATGQMPTIYNGGSWGVDGASLSKSAVGANAGAGDGVHWACGAADGWLETVFGVGSGIIGAAGLAMRAVDSTSRLQTSNNGVFERVGSVSTRISTYSQTLVPGDGHGVLMVGSTIKSYRRVGNAGPWVLVNTVTSTVNQALQSHGIRNADTTNPLTKYDYIKFIAGATAPPVVG